MKKKLIGLLMISSLTASAAVAQKVQAKSRYSQQSVKSQHHVVMQLSSSDTLEHKGLMNNLKNLKQSWGNKVSIEVVVHGPGIEMLTNGRSTQQESIRSLIKQGIRFVACRNTMKQKGISEEQILPG